MFKLKIGKVHKIHNNFQKFYKMIFQIMTNTIREKINNCLKSLFLRL